MSTSARTLYDISADILALEQLLFESGGEIEHPEAERAIDAWFAELEQDRNRKLDNCAALIREFEIRAQSRKAEAKRLQERAAVDQNAADRLKARIKLFFEIHGLKTLETARFRLTHAMNGGVLPLILEAAPEDIPEEFQIKRVVVDIDKETIRHLLEKGEELEFAKLGERGSSLRIK